MTSYELIEVAQQAKDFDPNMIPLLKAFRQLVEKEQLEDLLEEMEGSLSAYHIDVVREELASINSNLLTT